MSFRRPRFRPAVEHLEDRIVPYTLSGRSWASTAVSASFMPDGTVTDNGSASSLFAKLGAVAPAETWQREFARALQTWASVTNLNFRFVPDSGAATGTSGSAQNDSRFGDIRLGAYPRSDGFVGYSYYPSSTTKGGDTFLNSSTTFQVGNYLDLYSTFLHEIGHSLGLDHSADGGAVMYPTIMGVYGGLAPDDVAGIQAIYGVRRADSYDSGSGNNTFGSASALGLTNGGVALSADLTSLGDVDYYRLVAPAGAGTLSVSLDARNLSLLNGRVLVYDAAFNLRGSADATGYGGAATLDLFGLTGGQTYYVVVDGAVPDLFGIGAYRLSAQFGAGVSPPTVSVGDVSLAEGNSGSTQFAFTVTLSAASANTVSVQYVTANGTAVAGSDYTAATGTVTFAPGETQKTVTVLVAGDTGAEGDETFAVNLSNPVNATLADSQGQGTIQNDDSTSPPPPPPSPPPPPPSVSVGDVSLTEGNSGPTQFGFTVTLSAASTGTITVNYVTADGTAVAGSDYTAASGTLTFAPGETQKTVTVAATGDTDLEADETFVVNLSSPVNATLADAQGQATIRNDDAAGGPGPDRFEVNNTVKTAKNFGRINNFRHDNLSLHQTTDVDHYSFVPTRKGTFRVTVTSADGGTLNLEVRNASQVVLASGQSETGTVVLELNLAASKRYYLRAKSAAGSVLGYSLQLARQDGGGAMMGVDEGHGTFAAGVGPGDDHAHEHDGDHDVRRPGLSGDYSRRSRGTGLRAIAVAPLATAPTSHAGASWNLSLAFPAADENPENSVAFQV